MVDTKKILALIIALLSIVGLIIYLKPLKIDSIANTYQYTYNNPLTKIHVIDRSDIDKIVEYLPTARFSKKSDWPMMFGDKIIKIFIQELNSPKSKTIAIYYLADRPKESFIDYEGNIYKLSQDDITFIESIIMPVQ